MLNKTSLFITLTALFLTLSATTSAKKIVIKTIPANADIFIDGQKVGEGTYTLKFETGNDFYIVEAQAPNYLPKRIRVLKSNPQKAISIRLDWDEALEASIGGGEGAYAANTWKDIICRKELTEDIAWKRLMSIATKYFSEVDVRDKSAGWIKTGWKNTPFTHQTVRTRMELRISFTDENTKSYRARIISEIKDNDCHLRANECFKSYDRVLKIYQPLLEELQTVVDGGE